MMIWHTTSALTEQSVWCVMLSQGGEQSTAFLSGMLCFAHSCGEALTSVLSSSAVDGEESVEWQCSDVGIMCNV